MTQSKKSSLKQHYTDAVSINQMMCDLLGNVDGLAILEPSVGRGAFLGGLHGRPRAIDAVDIDRDAIDSVATTFQHLKPNLYVDDFIRMFVEPLRGEQSPVASRKYDAIISNPPYGLYFDLEFRKRIKRLFPHLYARESFGLFFAFALSRLKLGGRYVFLLPDTFLSSVNHRPLRTMMCEQAAPTHIIRFPSKAFETVAFGYGNLCIVAGNRQPLLPTHTVEWSDAFTNDDLFAAISNATTRLRGSLLLQTAGLGWSASTLEDVEQDATLSSGWAALGTIADCRTGIYTGDNRRFIGYDSQRITHRLNGHPIEWHSKVFLGELTAKEAEGGIEGEMNYVPLARGGHREPFDRTAWAIRWDPQAIDYYKSNRKARFQNCQYYFVTGLSIPMVSTHRISAALLSGSVFDQGVVGVFPHDFKMRAALLLYLNSSDATKRLKRITNGSANNSANYLKRLPIPPMSSSDLKRADGIIERAASDDKLPVSQCDAFVRSLGECATTRDTREDLSAGT